MTSFEIQMLVSFPKTGYKTFFSITHLSGSCCHFKYYRPFFFGLSSPAGSRKGERERARGVQQIGSHSSQAVLCLEGCFLHSQETLILETDFLWQLIWASGKHSQLLQPAHKNEEGIEGGGNFETHLPHLTGCGVLPSIFFLLLTTIYFLFLSLC